MYGKGSVKPRLGLALSRKTEEMKYMYKSALHPKERSKTNYSENMFESAEVGLNAAKAEEEEILKKEQRKKQWAALIEARRAEEEEERERKIEEENKKYLEEPVQEQKRKLAAKKASDAAYQEGAKRAAMEALATFDREQEERRLQAERVKAMEDLSITGSG